MSWNWNENNEEKKEYETKGTVTISTEEYRDLITAAIELKAKGQREHDDWYKEYSARTELEGKLKKAEEKLQRFEDWMDSDNSLRPKFRLWQLENSENQEKGDE